MADTNCRLHRLTEAATSYAMMSVKKPESAATKATRRFGLPSITNIMSGGRPSVEMPSNAAAGLLEAKKELDENRVAIVFMTYELGMGRLAFPNNDLQTARKHFQNPLHPAGGS